MTPAERQLLLVLADLVGASSRPIPFDFSAHHAWLKGMQEMAEAKAQVLAEAPNPPHTTATHRIAQGEVP